MSQLIASMHVEIGAKTKGFEQGAQKVKNELSGMKQKVDQATKPFVDINSIMSKVAITAGVVGTAVFAMKRAYDFSREGAELDFVRGKFDRLALSVGTTKDALLNDLKRATRGTVSDMELIASATDFMTLGLAKSHDEVVRLAKVAGALGMNMNQLVLTLTNQTTMRFDALGVSVDGFDEKVKRLKDSGMNASDAFKEAFLQQAEEQLVKVGEAADTSVGGFLRLEAATKNLADAIKTKLTPAANNFYIAGNNQVGFLDLLAAGFEGLTEFITGSGGTEQSVALLARTMAKANGVTEWQLEKNPELRKQYFDLARAAIVQDKAYLDAAQAALGLGSAVAEAGASAQTAARDFGGLLNVTFDLQSAQDKYTQTHDDLIAKREDLLKQIEKSEKMYGKESTRVKDLRGELGELNEAITENAEQFERASKKIVFNLIQQQMAADGLSKTEFSALVAIADQWGIIDSETADAAITALDWAEKVAQGKAWLGDVSAIWGGLGDKKITLDIGLSGAGASLVTGGGIAEKKINLGGGQTATATHKGGKLDGWTLVGDGPGGSLTPYSELITPDGMVLPAELTRKLVESGLVQAKSAYSGAYLPPEDLAPTPPKRSTGSVIPSMFYTGGAGGVSSKTDYFGGGQTSTNTQTIAAATEAASAAVQPAVQIASASMQAVNTSQQQTQQLATQIGNSNDAMLAELQNIRALLQRSTLETTRAVRDAVAQAAA